MRAIGLAAFLIAGLLIVGHADSQLIVGSRGLAGGIGFNGTQAITSVGLTGTTYTTGAATATVIGAISVPMSPGPAFVGTLSITGTNASYFELSSTTLPSNLETSASAPTCSSTTPYSINIVATPRAGFGSATTQAETISCGVGVPVLIQHVSSSSNPAGVTYTTGGYLYTIPVGPNPVQWGDCLVLGITYLHGNTVTITDTLKNSWPAASVTADDGSGNYIAAIYVLPYANPGLDTLTVQVGSSDTLPFQYVISEYSNCSGVVSTTSSSAGLTPSSGVITAATFTPGNNNSAGGNIIWNYTAPAVAMAGGATIVSKWVAGTNFTLLNADITWATTSQAYVFYDATQWYTQATSAAITPSITATSDSTDKFNSVTVAIKAAYLGGSVPSSGIYLRTILHYSSLAIATGAGTQVVQAPMTGNLRVLEFASQNWAGGFNPSGGMTDSDGNTYTCPGAEYQFCYAIDNTHIPSPTNEITITWSSSQGEGYSMRVYDINNGTAYDTDTDCTTCVCTNVSGLNGNPLITPTHAPGLVLTYVPLSVGPGYAVLLPAGAIWDAVLYDGLTDASAFDNSDLLAHFYNSTTAAENWTWIFSVQAGNNCSGESIAFH
jgi:hypothetical protein